MPLTDTSSSYHLRTDCTSNLALEFIKIPTNKNWLTLTWNLLGNTTADDLEEAVSRIPPTITDLGLRLKAPLFVTWRYQSGMELTKCFLALPGTVSKFGLLYHMQDQSLDPLKKALRKLPPTISFLDLSGNSLGEKNSAELISLLRVIPSSVRQVDLSNNLFEKKGAEDLVEILSSIPVSVKTIILGKNLFINNTPSERGLLIKKLKKIAPNRTLELTNSGEWVCNRLGPAHCHFFKPTVDAYIQSDSLKQDLGF